MLKLNIYGLEIEMSDPSELDVAWAKEQFEREMDSRCGSVKTPDVSVPSVIVDTPRDVKTTTVSARTGDLPGPSFDDIPTEEELKEKEVTGWIVGAHFDYDNKIWQVTQVIEEGEMTILLGQQIEVNPQTGMILPVNGSITSVKVNPDDMTQVEAYD